MTPATPGGGIPDRVPAIPDVLRRLRDREHTHCKPCAIHDAVSAPPLRRERLRFRLQLARHDLDRLVVTPLRWFVLRRLPRALVYWVTIHAVARAVRGDELVPAVPAMEVVSRWGTGAERRAADERRYTGAV